ncbi:RDD family protein [Flavobacterium sp. Fl-77]|uniref:RDD family protein n=1 Tax=Flavobacterium flavipigmentatum TaxID=2893884 RepID=A0AAJ2W1D7_9FLAO|nr:MULTISPECIES: RDD family protein [unclassified Flavobacterium]MDX6182721.1 RDD family protein [Flavobacterium sp. Fl-33]MDX6186100.1 RDD family protein [Flavobacterium sp. Fl-77]UFH38249.1 RDD family protein [Flavobacterium sp. F-70]
MIHDFTEVMSKKTDEELIQILTINADKYQSLAIEAARYEIKSRNIDITKIDDQREMHKEVIALEKLNKIQKQKDTLQNIAGTSVRGINFFIDITAIFIIYTIVVCTAHYGFKVVSPRQILFINRTTIITAFLLYFIVGETLFQKTLGKIITKTKVVNLEGQKATLLDIIVRTFCRLIPFDGISYLYTLNGFHDKVSKTVVIKETQF